MDFFCLTCQLQASFTKLAAPFSVANEKKYKSKSNSRLYLGAHLQNQVAPFFITDWFKDGNKRSSCCSISTERKTKSRHKYREESVVYQYGMQYRINLTENPIEFPILKWVRNHRLWAAIRETLAVEAEKHVAQTVKRKLNRILLKQENISRSSFIKTADPVLQSKRMELQKHIKIRFEN